MLFALSQNVRRAVASFLQSSSSTLQVSPVQQPFYQHLRMLSVTGPQFYIGMKDYALRRRDLRATLLRKKQEGKSGLKEWEMNREMRKVKTTPPQEVADLRLGPNVQYTELPIICIKATYN